MNLEAFRNHCPYCNGLMFEGVQGDLIEKGLYMVYDQKVEDLKEVERSESVQKLVPSLLPSLKQDISNLEKMLGIKRND